MKKILLSILILILYINSNAQSPLRINKYLIDSLGTLNGSVAWRLYHDTLHNGSWSLVGSGGGGGGAGTVTSVAQSFTGGLISVGGSPITTSGTLALTVAGTSGGIPYFSSTSAWASSGLLAANAIMIGGGAGTAPSTTTTGTGVLTALGVNVGSAGAFITFNGAAGTPSSITLTNGTGLLASGITLTDNTTNDVSTSAHGFFPKLTSNTVYYVNNSGALVALALGSSGQVLQSNGATSAPTFETPSAGGTTWNGITDPTGDQALSFAAGESSTWTDANTTEDLFTVNSSTGTTNSIFSLNRTGTALASGNNIMELVSSGANGTNAITATGLRISVTNTNGTSGTNVAISATASGATTNNYAAQLIGKVGVNGSATTGQLQVATTNDTAPTTIATWDGRHSVLSGDGSSQGGGLGVSYSSGSSLAVISAIAPGIAWQNLHINAGTYSFNTGGTSLGFFQSTSGRVGIGTTTITASLTLKAGSTGGSSAPLKFLTGALQTSAEAGTHEYNNSHYMTKESTLRFGLGGGVADFTADANNSGTGETDLYSYTTPASTLAATGEKLEFTYTINLSDITATAQIKVLFGGTTIGDTGALTISATGVVVVNGYVIRTGASTARSSVTVSSPTTSTAIYTAQTDLTGLTFTNTNILKVTGTAAGAGGGDNDITGKLGFIKWFSAAAN